jgi:hypothetical protein
VRRRSLGDALGAGGFGSEASVNEPTPELTVVMMLSELGVPPDVLEMLTIGDGRGNVAPGSLRKALAAVKRAEDRARTRAVFKRLGVRHMAEIACEVVLFMFLVASIADPPQTSLAAVTLALWLAVGSVGGYCALWALAWLLKK